MIAHLFPHSRFQTINTSHGLTSKTARMFSLFQSTYSIMAQTKAVTATVIVIYLHDKRPNHYSIQGRAAQMKILKRLTLSSLAAYLMSQLSLVRHHLSSGDSISPRQCSAGWPSSSQTSSFARPGSTPTRRIRSTAQMTQASTSLTMLGSLNSCSSRQISLLRVVWFLSLKVATILISERCHRSFKAWLLTSAPSKGHMLALSFRARTRMRTINSLRRKKS